MFDDTVQVLKEEGRRPQQKPYMWVSPLANMNLGESACTSISRKSPNIRSVPFGV